MKHLGITTVLAAVLSIGNLAAKTFEFTPDLKIGFDVGSTGVGFTVESRINEMLGVRTGFDWIPHFEVPLQFKLQVGNDDKPGYDKEGRSRFDRMADYLEEATSLKIDQQVDMIGTPHMYNFKVLIDIYPLNDKRWYFTTGFYVGPSVIARAQNCAEDMTTLIAAAIYNNIYDNIYDAEYNNDGESHGAIMGLDLTKDITDKIFENGRMGMHVGDYKNQTDKGSPVRYMLEPGADNMVRAEMRVSSFKPYLGVGFNGGFIDKNYDRLKFIIDCGVLFWGGHPRVYTHDGTEIVDGLTNINRQIGRYVDMVRPFEVFPVLNLTLTYRLFK